MASDDKLIVLRTTDSRPEADVLRSLLEAYGIPVYVRGSDMPGVGGVTEVNTGYRIMIPAEAENDAPRPSGQRRDAGTEGQRP